MKSIHLNSFSILLIFSIFSFKGSAQLNGNYTIGGVTPDFVTIQSAVDALNLQGVSGSVNFKLRSGTYTERITIGLVSGVSATSQITFESEAADSSTVWWVSTSSNDLTNYVVKCDAARFINFKKISFRNTGYGSGVFILSNGTSNCHIENCHLTRSTVPTSNYSRHIQINSITTVDSNLYILNNKLENAGYGIICNGQNSTLRDSNIVVTGNVISGYQGILMSNIENCLITQNKLTLNYRGISITGYGAPLNIEKNNVVSNEKALYLQQNQGNLFPLAPLWIANNFFIGRNGAVDIQSGSSTTQIVNNSVLNKYSGSNNSTLIVNTGCGISNNILANEDGGVALNIVAVSFTVVSDYNLMYTNGSILVYRGGTNFASLQNWQAFVLGQDQHSYQQPPNFFSSFDLHIISNSYLYNKGQANAWIVDDIDGQARVGLPDIGADEFVQPTVDAEILPVYQGVEEFDCSGVKPLKVFLKNNGTSNLTSATINWSINNSLQVPVNWLGNLGYTQVAPAIDLPFDLIQDSFASIKVWVTNPNGTSDVFPQNDILQIDTIRTRMNGTYSVGNLSVGYTTIQEAVDDLELRGTCNNVTISIVNGTYFEHIILSSAIERTTLQDTLFFVSTSGNRDSVIWAQPTSNPWTLELVNINNVVCKDLTLRKHVYQFGNSYGSAAISGWTFSNYEFNNCIFETFPATPTSGSGIYYAEGSDVRVKNCLFRNLNRAIDQSNGSTQNDPENQGLLVEDCEFQNIWEFDIMVSSVSNLNILRNHFTNTWSPTQPGGASIAMFLSYVHHDLKIEGNKFDGQFKGLLALDFYPEPGNNGKIQNNFFSYESIATAGGVIGVTLHTQGYLEVVHNSFNVVQGPVYSGLPAYFESFISVNQTYNSLIVKNNSFKTDSSKYVYYNCFPQSNPNIGYNNISVGYLEVGYDFTFGTQLPPNTTLLTPSYVSDTDLHLTGDELLGLGINLGVQYDIDSTLRPNPPTIGAVEAIPVNYDLEVSDIYAFADCDSISFFADVLNHGLLDVDSMWIHYTLTGFPQDSLLLTDLLHSLDVNDSILLLKIPLVRDSLYAVWVGVDLLGNTDQELSNNTLNWSVSYPQTPIPTLGSDTMICYGTTYQLNIQTNPAYESIIWNNGQYNGFYSITAEIGVNTIHLTDLASCEYFDTIEVSIESEPVLTISYSNDTIFGNGDLCDWYLAGVLLEEDVIGIVPANDGAYYYKWTSFQGCEYFSFGYDFSSVGLNEQNAAQVVIYPNPFNEYLIIGVKEDLLLTIYDAQMKKIGDFHTTNGRVDTEKLSSGCYFIELKLKSEEVIKERVVKL